MRRGLAAAALLALALPAVAQAHGLVGRQDLPIPRWLFFWGAGVVLVVSFVALAVLWPEPKLQEPRERRIASVPRALEVLCGAAGAGAFGLVVYAGLAGTQIVPDNLAPTAIYVLFWVGLPVLSLIFGDVFAAVNPWRAVGRAVGWMSRRAGSGAMPEPLAYPARLGRWPAAVAIFGFAWLELVSANGDDPSTLAVLALAYAAVQLVGMGLYGVEPWLRNADGFAVLFSFFGRLAPLRWGDGAVHVRKPLSGLPGLDAVPGTVALVCVAIGSTSFDGFSGGKLWTDWAPELQARALDLGFNQQRATEAAFTIGLLGGVLVAALVYAAGVGGIHLADRGRRFGELARLFAHTLVPIAAAYVIAHYFSLLAYQGQALPALASDPLGDGSDWLGTADTTIDYGVVSANDVWYVQVGALVVGHVCALVLAHDRALVTFPRGRVAILSQVFMLLVMVCFTLLGLWLLSAAAAQ
jgi:hypothetical protein